jgi:hypothetical protein
VVTINYGHHRIRLSRVCPSAVYTGMFTRPIDNEFEFVLRTASDYDNWLAGTRRRLLRMRTVPV